MPKRNVTTRERKAPVELEAAPEEELEITPPEPETHPHIDADTPHVDPTGASDFDRPYDQWSNKDLMIRARQLGVQGGYGHGELIDKIREAERRLEEQETSEAQPS